MTRRLLVALLALLLVLSGCGGDNNQGAVTTTTIPPFEPLRPGSAFMPIAGHEFVELPPEFLNEARAELESDPDLKPYLRGLEVRSVAQNGEGKAVVVALGFDP